MKSKKSPTRPRPKIDPIKAWQLAARHVLSQLFLRAPFKDGSQVRLSFKQMKLSLGLCV